MKKNFITTVSLVSILHLSAISFCHAENANVSGIWNMDVIYPVTEIEAQGNITIIYRDDGHSEHSSEIWSEPWYTRSPAQILINQSADGTITGKYNLPISLDYTHYYVYSETITGKIVGTSITFRRTGVHSEILVDDGFYGQSITHYIEDFTGEVDGQTISGTSQGNLRKYGFKGFWDVEMYGDAISTETITGSFVVDANADPVVNYFDKNEPSQEVFWAAADGESRVIIRVAGLSETDTVNISIANEDEDGRLEDDGLLNNGIFTQTYVSPVCFVRSGHPEDLTASTRSIDMDIAVNDNPIEFEPLSLIRPPVIMVHGLWGDPGDFSQLGDSLAENGWSYLYFVSYDNKAHFSQNIPEVRKTIDNSLQETRRAYCAITKIDIVAHSMGGCLTKLIDETFLQKNVRKIITIGTPHQGSPVANKVLGLRETDPVKFNILQGIFNHLATGGAYSLSGGAVEDLRTNLNIPAEIPGVDCENVFVGRRDDTPGQNLPLYLTLARWVTDTNFSLPDQVVHDKIFGPNVPSDWVVSLDSQKGNAPDSCEIHVSWHSVEPCNEEFIRLVVEALNKPAQINQISKSFTVGSNQTNALKKQDMTLPIQQMQFNNITTLEADEFSGTVEIITPTEGQTCTAGESITVSVQGSGDTTQAAIFAFFGTSSWADIVQLPWANDINIPSDSVGSAAEIFVIGLDANMNMTAVDEVNIVLDTNVALEDIIFGFGYEYMFDFQTYPQQSHEFQLYPLGVFSDGSEHPLSVLSEQTTYRSLKESVATVDSNGLLTVHSGGMAPIVVENSSVTAIFFVEVVTYNGDLKLDGRVNFSDFAVFASAWMSRPGDLNWKLTCDISDPKDNIIDWNDLTVFISDWLIGAE